MHPTRPRTRSTRSAADDERGAGVVSALAGTTAFLVLLLFATQLLLNLYATSVVTAAAFDAARVVAGSDGGPGRITAAEAQARHVLGRYGKRVRFDWSIDDDVVALRVRATNPNFLLTRVGTATAFQRIDRTVRVRVERFR